MWQMNGLRTTLTSMPMVLRRLSVKQLEFIATNKLRLTGNTIILILKCALLNDLLEKAGLK